MGYFGFRNSAISSSLESEPTPVHWPDGSSSDELLARLFAHTCEAQQQAEGTG